VEESGFVVEWWLDLALLIRTIIGEGSFSEKGQFEWDSFFFSLLSLALSPFLLLAAQRQEMGGAWMPGSIRTRHPRPTEAGTKASWQEFLHSEPRACRTSPPPPQKSTPHTTRSGKLPHRAWKRPTRLKH